MVRLRWGPRMAGMMQKAHLWSQRGEQARAVLVVEVCRVALGFEQPA
jgi:hypothetical protein